jgi:hypothetical protein
MIRKGKAYAPFEILPLVVRRSKRNPDSKVVFDGDPVEMGSDRLRTFARYGLRCARCGIEGRKFFKERRSEENTFQFNLYAEDAEGQEILMVKDSIFPKSVGTSDDLSNWQPMCAPCKQRKRRGKIDQMDMSPHVIFTDEGVEVLEQVYSEVKMKPANLAGKAFLQDDGNLLIQTNVGGDQVQILFPPDLWRWTGAIPRASDEELPS